MSIATSRTLPLGRNVSEPADSFLASPCSGPRSPPSDATLREVRPCLYQTVFNHQLDDNTRLLEHQTKIFLSLRMIPREQVDYMLPVEI